MQTILVVVHLFIAVALVGLILIQHGKGADAGAAFGSGASGTVFGSRGSASFLSRTTAILAALFFVTSLGLAWLAMQTGQRPGLMEGATPEAAETAPAAPEPAAATEVPSITSEQAPAADTADGQAPSEVPSVAPETAPAATGGETPKAPE
jgi:preprotein translocase subunit SecG